MKLEELLGFAIEKEASDILFSPGRPVSIRANNVMSFMSDVALSGELTRRVLQELASAEQVARFDTELELDWSVARCERRFRAKAF
jgi:Tfp pilus assembly ATPase PilU